MMFFPNPMKISRLWHASPYPSCKLLTLLVLASAAAAVSGHAAEEGFTARVGAGIAVVNKADNLSGNGYARVESLSEKPRSTTNIYPLPLLELAYRKGSNELYFGRSTDDPAGLVAGLKHRGDEGVVDLQAFYLFFGEEWQDPYLVGADREETDVERFGMKVAWNGIYGTSLGLSYRAMSRDVEQDLRGELTPELRRDGIVHILQAGWKPQIGTRLTAGPSVYYQRGALDGRSERYDGYGASLEATCMTQTTMLTARVSGMWSEWEAPHPLFGKTRREMEYGAATVATFFNPFGFDNYFISTGISHRTTSADIDFFDSQSTIGFGTVGYSF